MTTTTERRSGSKRRTSTAAATGAPPESLRAQGLRTRNAIIRVARKLLLESGSLEFSLRAVAIGAGISISNLQYYFPTRMAVVRAVMQPIIDAYLDRLNRALDSSATPREALDQLLQRALEDAKDAKGTALWWHFVSLASTDPECSRLLEDWYDTLTRQTAQLIRAVNPACKPAESVQAATLLIAMADGLALQLGSGRRKRESTRGLDTRFVAAVHHLVWGDSAPGNG
jgi:AcrR family transcriptional regulator